MASYLHRTAQPSTLAIFRSWGSSTGAGRIRLAAAKIGENVYCQPLNPPKGEMKGSLCVNSLTLFSAVR